MDEAQFDEYYRATVRRMLRYAYAICGDLAAAQDVVQEAYLRAWQRRRRLSSYDDVEAWLRLVVTRLCTDRWRRLAVHRRALERLEPPEAVPPPSEDTVVLVAALRGIQPKLRRALVLHYLVGLPAADIAVETGVPAATVRSWLARGRAQLAARLADHGRPDAADSGLPVAEEGRR